MPNRKNGHKQSDLWTPPQARATSVSTKSYTVGPLVTQSVLADTCTSNIIASYDSPNERLNYHDCSKSSQSIKNRSTLLRFAIDGNVIPRGLIKPIMMLIMTDMIRTQPLERLQRISSRLFNVCVTKILKLLLHMVKGYSRFF